MSEENQVNVFELEVGNRHGHSCDNFACPPHGSEIGQTTPSDDGDNYISRSTRILFEGVIEDIQRRSGTT